MTDTITVPLSKPLMHDGKEITSLTFREATAGDACAADLVEGPTKKMLAIMSGMTGVPLPVLMTIPMREITRIATKVTPLMGE